ncbi:MAG: VanW family protein [Chloroflexi bacterium]|nr:VanW family protein [Chloroflexota bacterium]
MNRGNVSHGASATLRGPGPVEGRSWLAPVFGVSALAGVVGLAALVFQVAYADRIVSGVRVLGLDLGGQSLQAGKALLEASASQLGEQPVTLRAGGREWQLPAAELGMRVDADAMVQQAYRIGRDGNPIQRVGSQWGALLFGTRFGIPLLEFDAERQDAVLRRIGAEIDQSAIDARIDTQLAQDGRATIVVVPEMVGQRLRARESAQRMNEAVSRGLPTTVDLVVDVERPVVTRVGLEPARARAQDMVAGPVMLSYANSNWTLTPHEIARTLTFRPEVGNQLQVEVDADALGKAVSKISAQIGQAPSNARFQWNSNGSLTPIRESQDGIGVDAVTLARTLQDRLNPTQRAFPVALTTTRAAVTVEDGASLGITELIKEGRTEFPGASAEKQHNVKLAASRLNGTVVPPGEIFSFNKEVGPTTLGAGFQTGWGITISDAGAQTIPAVAGGICQVATTLFQPVFHAGYAIEQRNYHLYWIQSYGQPPLGMKGLDATVDESAGLDFKFVNNTQNYLLIQSRVEGTTLIFGLYGTKPTWDVKIFGPVITSVVPTDPAPRRENEPTMPEGRSLQVEAAQDGFDVTVTRTVTDGDEVRTLPLRSRYLPAHNVILYGGPPEPKEEPPASSPDPNVPVPGASALTGGNAQSAPSGAASQASTPGPQAQPTISAQSQPQQPTATPTQAAGTSPTRTPAPTSSPTPAGAR